jgi:hypothetical protein
LRLATYSEGAPDPGAPFFSDLKDAGGEQPKFSRSNGWTIRFEKSLSIG